VAAAPSGPTASDGTLLPDRGLPTFERDLERMFASIADRYDAFNHLATFGQDLVWRPRAVWELERFHVGPIVRVLDVGCGTGGLARLLARRYRTAAVLAADFSPTMVRSAWRRSGGRTDPELGFAVAHIGHLPFRDGTFDVATNAFVARNLTDLAAAFRELRRVLRPGGTLLTLEVAEPASPLVGRVFHAHFDHAVPLIGRAFGREGPYSYLPKSLRSLPPSARLLGMLREAGFDRAAARSMSLGIVTAYLGAASRAPDGRG
jgi:demethylmenaquinone methyltransferase / 2-methoxy-6-polyprenyl-1,4-benzoquinol methylase